MERTCRLALSSVLFLVIVLVGGVARANTYYVSTSGSDSAAGTSAGAAWKTIGKAVATAVAGDIVYIKAGNYKKETLSLPRSGTAAAPIVFQGYRATPGDLPQSTYKVGDGSLDASVMPLLDGADKTGTALSISGRSYVELRNLQIQNYTQGVRFYDSTHVTVENVTVINCNPAGTAYVGKGIVVSGDYNTVRNCTVTDAGAEGLPVYGNYNLIEDSRVYGYSDDNAMDYYLNVLPGPNGTGDHNIVRRCLAHRVNNLSHGGHGIGTKSNTQYNQFIDCEAINFHGEDFLVRHSTSAYNEFIRCTARGGKGIVIRDGAHHNTFRDCRLLDVQNGVTTFDSIEDGRKNAGHDNLIVNTLITNATTVIDLNPYGYPDTANFYDNKFVNCTVAGANSLFAARHASTNNEFINCIFSGIGGYNSGSYTPGFTFTHNAFSGNGFAVPSGTGNFGINPDFVDAANGDFHLQASSACIDKGTAVNAPSTDLEGHPRPQGSGVDIGVYEYGNAGPVADAGSFWDAASNVAAPSTETPDAGPSFDATIGDAPDPGSAMAHTSNADESPNASQAANGAGGSSGPKTFSEDDDGGGCRIARTHGSPPSDAFVAALLAGLLYRRQRRHLRGTGHAD
jgi:hypothetical protein